MTNRKSRHRFGLPAVIIGLVTLTTALMSPWLVAAFDPSPPIEEVVAEKATGIINRLKEKIGEPEETPKPVEKSASLSSILPPAIVGTSIIGLILGAISYLRREDRRFYTLAIGVNTAAVISLFGILLASGVILAILIVGAIIAAIGLLGGGA